MMSITLGLIVGLSCFIAIFGMVMVCLVQPGAGGGFTNDPNNKPATGGKIRSQEDSLYDVLM